MTLLHADPFTIQHRKPQSLPSYLSNLVGRVLGLPNLSPKQTTEDTIRSFLRHFDTTDLPSVDDATLEAICIKEAERRGYTVDVLMPYMTVGLNITAPAYRHLTNIKVKIYIVFFTAFVAYFDDVYPDDPDAHVGVPNFTKHFASSEKQPTKMLEVINFTNDITSFYKEECDNETHNLISILAESWGEPKSEALYYVVEKCMEAHERTMLILSPHQEVRSSYDNFLKGYLAFYLGAKRYRLSELNL
ncbi:hypothetical protein EDD18DRAFT_1124943 [Armillaria luteobubalina]|uniref:Terpenoid synthase n=1 Tax=Armillaria luteobubalina TaxID=153913 RepID=A0AA39QRT8_9AGAR|nr:hypothetical protein EDD18DRAFT_1124943 [Armillaria luteobubalina]